MSQKDRLAVLCAKNPAQPLYNNIINLKQYYPEFDIVIVDSDSENTEMLKKIQNEFPDVIIEYAKNRNYELGAWYHAFYKYNDYKVYMFLQDALIATCRIPNLDELLKNPNIFNSFHYEASISDGGYIENLRDVYRGTKFNFISEFRNNYIITGGAHSSFIAHKDICAKIIELEDVYREKQLVKSKIDSWLSERTVGLMAEHLGVCRVDIIPYFTKINSNRM